MDLLTISSIFFTLFFVVDPIGLIPVFLLYLSEYSGREKYKIIFKSIIISIIVSIFFIVAGKYLMFFLGITTGSFLVAGGIILLIISIEMLFGRNSRIMMRNVSPDDKIEGDISVFPLAIPLICGPVNVAALLMFSTQFQDDFFMLGILIASSIIIFIITMIVMIISQPLGRLLGTTGISITQRLIGLILSAMSIQFISNGIKSLQ